jgi:hypothetical protein
MKSKHHTKHKRHTKKAKRIRSHFEIHRAHNGAFIVHHHFKKMSASDRVKESMPDEEPETHIMPDMESLQNHVQEYMNPEMTQTPQTPPEGPQE